MLKRFFWLVLGVAAGVAVWLWLRQLREDNPVASPQFAPPRPFDRPDLSLPTLAPAPDAAPPPAIDEPAAVLPETPEPSPVGLSAAETAVSPETAHESTSAVANGGAEDQPETNRLGEVIGYCVRCKTKRPISEPHLETTESGRRAARGICPVCGANMFTFLKDEPDSE